MRQNNDIKPTIDCDAILELIPDYAFGLSTPEEERMVQNSLHSCPEAATQLEDYRLIQETMRLNVPQIDPPEELGERLMASIRRKPILDYNAPRRSRLSPAGWLAGVAILALILTNAFWLINTNNLSHADNSGGTYPAYDKNIVLTTDTEVRWVRLPSSQEDSYASALLMWNVESKLGILYVQGFPQLTSGKTYQLWLTRGDVRQSAGTFHVNEEGNGVLLFQSEKAVDEFTWARITEEAGYDSKQPSDHVVVNGEL